MPRLPDACGETGDRALAPEHAPWPCRYCRARDTVVITWRDPVVLVCFCKACELGWRASARGEPKDR